MFMLERDMLKYLVECVGTFMLVFVILRKGEAIPIAITLLAMIYVGGNISGAAYNPAVSMVSFLQNKISSTTLEYLDNEMRVNELARMIGGIQLTDKALQFAKELID